MVHTNQWVTERAGRRYFGDISLVPLLLPSARRSQQLGARTPVILANAKEKGLFRKIR